MKRWNFLVLGLVLLLGPGAWAQAPVGSGGTAQADADSSARALAVYEEGKRLYDAKDYAGALEKFDQAAALEPNKARWQYNRGLTLRKLNRYDEARDALLQSRALDPEYKRAEIDDKLREMGFSPEATGGDTAQDPEPQSEGLPWNYILPVLVVGILAFKVVRALTRHAGRRKEAAGGRSRREKMTPVSGADLARLGQRLERVSSALASVEHALRLEEDADLRAMLNQATQVEHRAYGELEQARLGMTHLEPVESLVRAAEEASRAATERARTLFGDRAFVPEGERVGCYFCARPLANPSFRQQVPLKQGTQVTHVLSCPPCANMASAGKPPLVKVRMVDGKTLHWSELGGYDPYTHRHKPYPGSIMLPSWDFAPQRSVGEVAAIAAGGALAGGLAAYAVSELLDLDGAREAALAQAATQAAAMQASQRREERDWRDHS